MTAALWSSGFRPFFLLGAAYGPVVLLGGLPLWSGSASVMAPPLVLWHGHELLYGFASAFICGFVLTALPGWAGTPEINGAPLAGLVVTWLAARVAAWSYGWLPLGVIGALDLLLFPALAALVLPGLVRALDRRYLALVPILFGFICADAIYHRAVAQVDYDVAQRALGAALNVLVVLFTVVGGLLTPIFTQSALQQTGCAASVVVAKRIEIAAICSVVAFAAADWADVPPMVNGAVAILAALIHGVRLSRWRMPMIWTNPLVLAMHVGYGWLVAAMALRGLADATGLVPREAWIHAFTVGALGTMMLAFLNRVALRHTGRIVSPSPVAIFGLAVMFIAGVTRVSAAIGHGGPWWIAVSAVAWVLPFTLFLGEHGARLWQPSLPRDGRPLGNEGPLRS